MTVSSLCYTAAPPQEWEELHGVKIMADISQQHGYLVLMKEPLTSKSSEVKLQKDLFSPSSDFLMLPGFVDFTSEEVVS